MCSNHFKLSVGDVIVIQKGSSGEDKVPAERLNKYAIKKELNEIYSIVRKGHKIKPK